MHTNVSGIRKEEPKHVNQVNLVVYILPLKKRFGQPGKSQNENHLTMENSNK